MQRRIATLTKIALILVLVPAASAEAPAGVKADTRDAFSTAAADVRHQMEPDGRYAYVKADEREKVEQGLTEMARLFDAHASVAEMDKPTKVQLFNAQEQVNAILTLRDRDRLICERGASTGSRIVGTSCRTYGDIEAARAAGSKFMQERAATPCTAKCTGQ